MLLRYPGDAYLIAQITSHSDVEVMRPYIASTRKGKQKVVDALDNATQE